MANSIPLTFRASPLPEGYRATPEQFKNDIVARLYAESSDSISFFASGSVAPSSNVGPWLNNGQTWYVWNDGSASYVPQPIPQASLGYILQDTAPDETVYQLWVELDGTGKAITIKHYSGGAWKDVYADKLAAATASAVATANAYTDAAIAGIPSVTIVAGQGAFGAAAPAQQDLVFGAGGNQTGVVDFTEGFDPDNAFASNSFTAPANGYYQFNASVSASITAGAPTVAEINYYLRKNAARISSLNDESDVNNTGTRIQVGSEFVALTAGDVIDIEYDATVDAACTFSIMQDYTKLSGYRVR